MLRNSFGHPFLSRFFHNSAHSKKNLRKFGVKKVLVGVAAGSIAYDGYNEFEVCGGISRFLRSLRIAAQISLDYSWHLYGVSKNDKDYDKVFQMIILGSLSPIHKIIAFISISVD